MANRVVQLILQAKDQATAVLKKSEDAVGSWSSKATGAFKAVAALAATAALGKFFKDSVKEASDAERGMARLGIAVGNTGNDFERLRPSLESAIEGVRRLSTFSGGELRGALTSMITLTGDVGGSMKNLGLAADLAAARQIDLSTASDVVAKAMNGNTTALNKLGIEGKTANDVLDNLRTAVGGFAEGEAKTFGGRLENLNNGWKDFQEAVGNAILGTGEAGASVGKLSQLLADAAGWVERNSEVIGTFTDLLLKVADIVGRVVGFAFKGLALLLQELKGTFGDVVAGFGEFIHDLTAPLRFIGINIGEGVAKDLREAGAKWRDEADVAMGRITGAIEDGEKKSTAVVEVGAKDRTRLTKDELEAREKREKEFAKEREKIAEEIAVKSLMISKRLTEEQAKEEVRRHKLLTGTFGATVNDIQVGYERLERLNLMLAAGFNEDVVPAVKRTEHQFTELKADGIIPTATAMDRLAQQIGKTTDEIRDNAQRANQAEQDLGHLASAAIGAGQGMGFLDDEAAAALQNVVTLGEAVQNISVSGLGAGLPGLIGGLAGAISGLFGGDNAAKAKEFREWLEKNAEVTEDLASVNGELLRLSSPGTRFAGVQQALEIAFEKSGREGFADLRVLRDELLKRGLTFEDLEKVARDLGFEGPIDLKTLLEGISETQFTAFANTFAGQMERISRGVGIGAIAEGEQLAQTVGVLKDLGAPALTGALEGLDISTEEGRNEAIANLRSLFNNIGSLSASDFGALTGAEFLEAIENLIALLEDDVADLGGVLVGPGASVDPGQFGMPQLDLAASFDGLATPLKEQTGYLSSIDEGIATLVKFAMEGNTTTPVLIGAGGGDLSPVLQGAATATTTGGAPSVTPTVIDQIDQAQATTSNFRRLRYVGGITQDLR